MKTIVLIGAGQLGSRHLQALSRITLPVQIEVVDIYPASLETARSRYEEMPENSNIKNIRFVSSLQELSKKIDMAIVATNADIRAEVIRTLTSLCDVDNLVLEKVLFQKVDEYGEIQALLRKKGVKAWVNHARRAFPFYQRLKNLLSTSRQVSFQVQGGAWGLGCNGLHMIDLLAFLTGAEVLEISSDKLSNTILQSKRKGFVEFTGELSGQVGSHYFNLFCHEVSSPVIITISSDELYAIIDEANGWFRMATKENGWKWVEEKEKIVLFQSELTNVVVEDIFRTGGCDLPNYSEACDLHIPFIAEMLASLNRHSTETYEICPIT